MVSHNYLKLAIIWSSLLAKGYDPLYSSSPLASLDGFSVAVRGNYENPTNDAKGEEK
jgi:hypothetical protein